jgi:hypothetical protein
VKTSNAQHSTQKSQRKRRRVQSTQKLKSVSILSGAVSLFIVWRESLRKGVCAWAWHRISAQIIYFGSGLSTGGRKRETGNEENECKDSELLFCFGLVFAVLGLELRAFTLSASTSPFW